MLHNLPGFAPASWIFALLLVSRRLYDRLGNLLPLEWPQTILPADLFPHHRPFGAEQVLAPRCRFVHDLTVWGDVPASVGNPIGHIGLLLLLGFTDLNHRYAAGVVSTMVYRTSISRFESPVIISPTSICRTRAALATGVMAELPDAAE